MAHMNANVVAKLLMETDNDDHDYYIEFLLKELPIPQIKRTASRLFVVVYGAPVYFVYNTIA